MRALCRTYSPYLHADLSFQPGPNNSKNQYCLCMRALRRTDSSYLQANRSFQSSGGTERTNNKQSPSKWVSVSRHTSLDMN